MGQRPIPLLWYDPAPFCQSCLLFLQTHKFQSVHTNCRIQNMTFSYVFFPHNAFLSGLLPSAFTFLHICFNAHIWHHLLGETQTPGKLNASLCCQRITNVYYYHCSSLWNPISLGFVMCLPPPNCTVTVYEGWDFCLAHLLFLVTSTLMLDCALCSINNCWIKRWINVA